MHIRNRAGRTPLFLAANAGLSEHVLLLRKSGAHLHADERAVAEMHARRRPAIWGLAGVGPKMIEDREIDDDEDRNGVSLRMNGFGGIAGSAPS